MHHQCHRDQRGGRCRVPRRMSSDAVERLLCRGSPDHGVANGRRARPDLAHLCAWRSGSASNSSPERRDHDQRHEVRVSPRDSVYRGRDAVAKLVHQARHDDRVAPQPPATAEMFQTDWRCGLASRRRGRSIGSGLGSPGQYGPRRRSGQQPAFSSRARHGWIAPTFQKSPGAGSLIARDRASDPERHSARPSSGRGQDDRLVWPAGSLSISARGACARVARSGRVAGEVSVSRAPVASPRRARVARRPAPADSCALACVAAGRTLARRAVRV